MANGGADDECGDGDEQDGEDTEEVGAAGFAAFGLAFGLAFGVGAEDVFPGGEGGGFGFGVGGDECGEWEWRVVGWECGGVAVGAVFGVWCGWGCDGISGGDGNAGSGGSGLVGGCFGR